MARPLDLRRIQKEDFDADMQETIDKLAYPLNNFMEQTKSALDGNLDFTNFNQQVVNVSIIVDSTGRPTISSKYKSTLSSKVIGTQCISAVNTSSPGVYPTSCPFISFTQNGDLVTILNVTGLQANAKYTLTLISYGSPN